MAKKLISFDDAASSGTGLPDAVETVLHNTYAPVSVAADVAALEGEVVKTVNGLNPNASGNVTIDVESADPRSGRCHIIPGLGQSNMTQSDTTIPIAVADTRLFKFQWGSITQLPTTETYVLPQFAREYVNTIPRGDWVLIVPAAVGATGFTTTTIVPPPSGYVTGTGTWDRTIGDTNNLAQNAVDYTLAAKTAAAATASEVIVPVMLWSQGEGDTPRLNEAAYSEKLDDLFIWFRQQIGEPELVIVVGSMVPEYSYARGQANTAGVAAALAFTPARVLRTGFAWGPEGLPKQGEIIHFSTAAQVERGRLFLDAMYRARVNVTTTKPVEPGNLTISRAVSGRITARWEKPLCRVTGYDVEYTTDSGVTWNPMALDRDSRLRATTVVTPDLLVQVRIRTKSDGDVTESVWLYSETLFAVSGAPAPTETAETPIPDPPLDGGGETTVPGTRSEITHMQNLSPAHTGAASLYVALTLPESGGSITVSARSNDSTRTLSVVANQTSGLDQTTATTGGGTSGASFPAPKAAPGSRVYGLSVTADGGTVVSRRNGDAAIEESLTPGNILIETVRVVASGGAVVHGAYMYWGTAHTASEMDAAQEEIRVLHGLASV